LTSVVNATLGNSIVPGLYALGNPQRIELDEKMLLAQASAIVVGTGQRLGSVVLLRDITATVKQEQARDQIMAQIVEDVQIVLQDTSQRAMQNEDKLVRRLARDIAKHASALQSMIVEMRELTQYTSQKAQKTQRSLSVETLVWGVANDWRQIARANEITLSVILEVRGLFVLGDEQRLRYALGNLVDNAIKYTKSGGKLSIEVRGEAQSMLQLRIRDNGVGINNEDIPQVFVRYYRGNPTTDDGQVIHVPGMGQGLTDTQQIITAHGGQIRIKSKVGVGTAAYISLPITAAQSYQLPLIEDDVMEGETMLIPDNVTVDEFWGPKDDL
jgi:signal transduction histidine kinase